MNTEKILVKNIHKEKPCRVLGYCPYGDLVESYPFNKVGHKNGICEDVEVACKVFGHDCPMFYLAEDLSGGRG